MLGHHTGPKWATHTANGVMGRKNKWWTFVNKDRPDAYTSCEGVVQDAVKDGVVFMMNENWLPGGEEAPQNVR